MLFDTALVILMTGLITHVGNDAVGGPDVKSYAAVVKDDHSGHKPFIYVEGRFTRNGVDIIYELKPGDNITFEGIAPGGAEATPDFLQDTPSLAEPITQSLIHDAVKMGKDHDEVVAKLVYPAGALYIVDYHYQQSEFYRGDNLVRTQCVPSLTAFYGESTTPITMIIEHTGGTRTPYDLSDEAIVALVNQADPPQQPTDDEATEHFRNYGRLLKRRYAVIPRRTASVKAGCDCLKLPTLPEGTRVRNLATVFLTQYATTLAKPFASVGPAAAATSHSGVTSHASPIDMRISEHPACTNTDWP